MNVRNLSAYECIKQQTIDGIGSEGYLLRHKKSGATVAVLENSDENKVFTIGFRTPPENSTGVPHIIEHTVLCGSRNFPGKDPFVELIKGSLNTFINAITYPDKTIYPVASCNDKDFKNLMHVYLDAVFYPNIYKYREIFKQEGWSYKLEAADADLDISGVVYNEMKGAYSAPESTLDRLSMNALFPDNTYANSSGGDPKNIPELTYEAFIDFHKTYYHPSNSFVYLYGDMDMEERLDFLDREYLSQFDAKEIDSEIALQKPFDAMRSVEDVYSITSEESEENKTFLGYSKVVGGALDPERYMGFEILDYALLSAPGAPLKKALLEAGIGSEISGGYGNAIRQPVFEISVKGAAPEQKDTFVRVVEETLQNLVKNGIDRKALDAGINYLEFRYREADYGYWPKGLMYMLKMFDSWLYDKNQPFMHVDSLEVFETMKKKAGEGYFEKLIESCLLENPHGVIATVKPEKGLTAKAEKALKEKLAAYKSSLSTEEIENLVEETKRLKAYQEAPETKENLEKIPVIEISDIRKTPLPIQNTWARVGKERVLYHDIETNGICYMTLAFRMGGIPADLYKTAGILQAVLGLIDTENYAYADFFNAVNQETGGISTSIATYTKMPYAQVGAYEACFFVRCKALYEKMPVAFEMIEEMLLHSKLSDEKRIREILLEVKARMQSSIVANGHVSASRRAASYRSPAARFTEEVRGMAFYDEICHIIENFEDEKAALMFNLERLSKFLFAKERLLISVTSAPGALADMEKDIETFTEALYTGEEIGPMEALPMEKTNEGIGSSSKVQYVTCAGNFIRKNKTYTGALKILKVILSYDYLWQNIRVKGGAYGCMSAFSRSGEASFMSYRDPNLKNTYAVYEGIPAYLRNFQVSDRDMKKYIIGTISDMDHPMTPSELGERSLGAYLSDVTIEMLEKERQEVLGATQEDIRHLADIVEAVLSCDQKCVIGAEEVIEENRDVFGEIRSFN